MSDELRLSVPKTGKCAHCNRPILKCTPGPGGWFHKWSEVEHCDKSNPDSPSATPRVEEIA